MSDTNGLPAAIVAIVDELGDTHVRTIATRYRSADTYSRPVATAGRHALPASHRDLVQPLNAAWASAPATHGAAIALALEAALLAKQAAATATVDVVVTGPDSPDAPVRLTSEVVRQLIAGAEQRVML